VCKSLDRSCDWEAKFNASCPREDASKVLQIEHIRDSSGDCLCLEHNVVVQETNELLTLEVPLAQVIPAICSFTHGHLVL
jgi:hypothetical protein